MPISDPFSVVVHVPQNLGEAMKQFRSWLDQEKIHPTNLTTNIESTGFTITVGFASIESADRFRRQFASKSQQVSYG